MPGRELNASACEALVEAVVWDDPRALTILTVIAFIDLMVIVGNCLVIAAVYISSKLRSVTNLFIVSLAVADLMVGLAVLPFSATWEVFKVWIFGDLWCSVWLAVDVWMCTASILNLCAISLDRYVAVTRPVTYPSIMSMKRAKVLIASVWVLSFVICLPPLLGWKEEEVIMTNSSAKRIPVVKNDTVLSLGRPLTPGGATIVNAPAGVETLYYPHCPWICELTNETSYVIYSALGSFYIPMLVMLFFYWRIYRAAVQTTRAINRGFRTTKGTKAFGNRFDEQRLTLRIHRGKGSVMQGSSGSNSTTTTNSGANSVHSSPGGKRSPDTRTRKASSRMSERGTGRTHEKIKISVSYPSSDAISSVANNSNSPPGGSANSNSKSGSLSSTSPTSSGPQYAVHYQNSNTNTIFRASEANCHLRVTGSRLANSHRRGRRSSSSPEGTSRPRLLGDSLNTSINKEMTPSPTFDDGTQSSKPKLISRMGKRNIKAQVKRFRMETKAAKTLGIIVGGFIFCWLPFFTMYLFRAFCKECVNDAAFSVMFWLGYCNSAINPCIYALFSKDFRFAFKRIICKCFCSGKQIRRDSRIHRRGSDGSHLGVRRGERDRSSSYNNNEPTTPAGTHHSIGDDSGGENDGGSDSR